MSVARRLACFARARSENVVSCRSGASSRATGATRDRVVRALDYLAEQGLLEVEAGELWHRFRRLPPDLEELAQNLHRRNLTGSSASCGYDRSWNSPAATVARCRTSSAFCEPLAESCGHCSWCLNGRRRSRVAAGNGTIDPPSGDRQLPCDTANLTHLPSRGARAVPLRRRRPD